MRRAWIVELRPQMWLALGQRTTHRSAARKYRTEHGTKVALGIYRSWSFRWWHSAKVVPIKVGPECPIYDKLEPWPETES